MKTPLVSVVIPAFRSGKLILEGQTYWTIICAPEGPKGPELLKIVEGRKEKHLKPFWEWFGKERAQRRSLTL